MKKEEIIAVFFILASFLFLQSTLANIVDISSEVTITGVALPSGSSSRGDIGNLENNLSIEGFDYYYASLTLPTKWFNDSSAILRTYVGNFVMYDPEEMDISFCRDEFAATITRIKEGEYMLNITSIENEIKEEDCWIKVIIKYNKKEIVLKKDFIFVNRKKLSSIFQDKTELLSLLKEKKELSIVLVSLIFAVLVIILAWLIVISLRKKRYILLLLKKSKLKNMKKNQVKIKFKDKINLKKSKHLKTSKKDF